MVRKKRGSSLVTVVIISGVLITVGAAMLSMTLGDYKMRITESTRIKNLYSSDSGLDVAYDILIKTFDAGAIYGAKAVEDYKKTSDFIDTVASESKSKVIQDKKDIISERQSNDSDKESKIISINKDIDSLYVKIKEEEDKAIDICFKKNFNDFVYMNDKLADESKINSSDNRDELRKSIIGKMYVQDITKSSIDNDRYKVVDFNKDNKDNIIERNLFVDTDDQDNKGIKYNNINVDPENGIEYATRKYEIKITSKYITQDTTEKTSKTQTTERRLQSIYDMTVPDYKDVVFNDAKLTTYTFLNDNAIIIGGNMNVIDSPLSVKGNIFVQGNGYNDIDLDGNSDVDVSARAYDKYNGGIVLDANPNNKEIIFNGDVITGKTFNIRSNVNTNISGNLYAMNVYAGSENANDDLPKNSILNVKKIKDDNGNDVGGEVVVDNDITLKADSTNITIDKFYGINDKNIKYDEAKGFINGRDKPLGRTSSSIIVNAPTGNSNIKINTLAYIMGVAHINTQNGYSTGESIGIKGNYIAYAVPSVDGNEEFDYYDPLQLLKEDNVIIKSEHFVNYWRPILSTINTGGIQLPEKIIDNPETGTYSIGAIVYKDLDGKIVIKGSSYNNNIPSVIGVKQKEFASKVYNVGGEILKDDDKQVLYESLGNEKDKVSDLIDIEGTLEDYKINNKIFFKGYDGETADTPNEEINNEKAIFSDKNIKIEESDTDSIVRDGNDIIINVSKGNTLKAFIATSGTVTIEGKVDFQGNIIAEGNLNINTSENKTIQYNKALLDRIQASNVGLFNSVFGHVSEVVPETTTNLNVQYDVNKFVKSRLWKIIK